METVFPLTAIYNTLERRAKPRFECAYPAVVRGIDSAGARFEERATLANLSYGGLYLQMACRVDSKRPLFVMVRFPNTPPTLIALRGPIVRSESKPDGHYGLAIRLESHRFL